MLDLKVLSSIGNIVKSGNLLLFAVAILYILITEKKKTNRVLFAYIPLLSIVFIWLNPVLHTFLGVFMKERDNRYIWVLCYSMVIAYAMVKFVNSFNDVKKQIIVSVTLIILIMCACTSFYTSSLLFSDNELVQFSENVYQVPQRVIEVADIIEKGDLEPKAIVTKEVAYNIRNYDGNLQIYGTVLNWFTKNLLVMDIISADTVDVDMLFVQLSEDKVNYNYIVCKKDSADKDKMQSNGFAFYSGTQNYDIFKREV